MKDQLLQFARNLVLHADRSVIIVLAIILGLIVILFSREQATSETPLKELPSRPFEELFPNDAYKKVIESYLTINSDITKDVKLRPLIEFNMFDYKEVKAQDELEKEYDKQVDEADKLMKAGKKSEALKVLDSILSRKPNQVRALDLKNQILPPPTTTPTPTPAK